MHFQDRVDGGHITIENGAPRGHLTLHGLSEHQAAKQHDLRVINQQGVLVYSSLQAGEQKERACPLHVIVIPLKNLLSTAKVQPRSSARISVYCFFPKMPFAGKDIHRGPSAI